MKFVFLTPKYCNRQVRSLRLPAEDDRQQTRRCTCVHQEAVNKAGSAGKPDSEIGDPEGW